MPTTYFFKDVNVDTTCDGTSPFDLTTTQGTGTTHSIATQDSPYADQFSYQADVSGDSPVNGTFDTSIDVTTADAAGEFQYRLLVRFKNSGCTTGTSEGTDLDTGPSFTGTGIKTDTTASLTFGSNVHLDVTVQGEKLGNHGNKGITYNINDADTWVLAPWPLSGFGMLLAQSRNHMIRND